MYPETIAKCRQTSLKYSEREQAQQERDGEFFRLEPPLNHILKKSKHGIRAPDNSAMLEWDSENEKNKKKNEKKNYSKLARTLR